TLGTLRGVFTTGRWQVCLRCGGQRWWHDRIAGDCCVTCEPRPGLPSHRREDAGMRTYDDWKTDVGPWPSADDESPARRSSRSGPPPAPPRNPRAVTDTVLDRTDPEPVLDLTDPEPKPKEER